MTKKAGRTDDYASDEQKRKVRTETTEETPEEQKGRMNLDEKISSHPFLQTFSLEQRKAMQSKHPVADVDAARYAELRKQFFNFLTDLLKIAPLILKDIYKSVGADYKQETDEAYQNDGYFKYILGDAEQYAKLPESKNTTMSIYFDGNAYMTAAAECIKEYDPNHINPSTGRKASFMGLFALKYRQCLNRIRQNQMNIYTAKFFTELDKETAKLLGRITRFLRAKGLDPERDLPEDICQIIADSNHISIKKLHNLLNLIQISQTTSIDAPTQEENGDLPQQMVILDPKNDPERELENQMEIFWAIQFISNLEMKDYNRLFMSNLLLYPLHPVANQPSPRDEDVSYKDALIQCETKLRKTVLDIDYLSFVGWKKADGSEGSAEDIQVLCYGYPLRPLNGQTIGHYKNVSSATVTYHKGKFMILLDAARLFYNADT